MELSEQEFYVSEFAPDQRDAVCELWMRSFKGLSKESCSRDISKACAHDLDLFLTALNSRGKLVGTIMCGFDGHRGWVYYLAVAPEWRRRGLGRMLLQDIESRLAKRGCFRISLQVRRSNQQIIGFYASCGYRFDTAMNFVKSL